MKEFDRDIMVTFSKPMTVWFNCDRQDKRGFFEMLNKKKTFLHHYIPCPDIKMRKIAW
jgi:hypothetical protein